MSTPTYRAIAWRNHGKTTVVTDEVTTDGPSFVRVVAECSDTGARDGQAEDEEAMARRIAACLNSCGGVPTDLLEEVQGLGAATMPYRVMRKQHAELLAALRGLHHVCQIALAGKDGRQFANLETRSGSFIHMVPVMQAAEDAIAGATADEEGGAA